MDSAPAFPGFAVATVLVLVQLLVSHFITLHSQIDLGLLQCLEKKSPS